jgi:hypothetical protein
MAPPRRCYSVSFMSRRSTLTDPSSGRAASPDIEPTLFLAFDSNHPKQPTWRHRLGGIDEVLVGRSRSVEVSREREGEREGDNERKGDNERLLLRFPDPWMSTDHARLRRGERGMTMTDPGSKNGSFINGVKRDSAVLTDGDLLQFGHTFFVYRDALPAQPGEPAHIISDMDAPPGLATVLAPLAQIFVGFARAALSDSSLLIVGERGTGKTALAHSAHALSGRTGPFVAVEPDPKLATRLVRQLCGSADAEGAVARAGGGTLLIDGLDRLPAQAQIALLDLMRKRCYVPEGCQDPVPVTCRFIAISQQEPAQLVAGGELDAALLSELSGFAVRLPPLRQRREDLGLLVAGMLEHYAPDHEVTFSADAAYALFCYPWPRNVRELESCIATALALSDAKSIDLAHLPPELQRPFHATQDSGGDTLDTIELTEQDLKKRAEIIAALRARSGDLVANTETLLKARSRFQDWLKRRQIKITRPGE